MRQIQALQAKQSGCVDGVPGDTRAQPLSTEQQFDLAASFQATAVAHLVRQTNKALRMLREAKIPLKHLVLPISLCSLVLVHCF